MISELDFASSPAKKKYQTRHQNAVRRGGWFDHHGIITDSLTEAEKIFSSLLLSGKLFFFAGSGISYGSGLPSAEKILLESSRALLPTLDDYDHEYVAKEMQPEVYYEAIIETVGDRDCLDLWTVLHPDVQKTFGWEARPTLSHYVIVEYSFKARKPIFTTNFDCIFEMASQELDIPYRVYLAGDMVPSDLEMLAICKLHGSIMDKDGGCDVKSIWTTATEIATFNSKWISYLIDQITSSHIVFVGYSGRDIDIFPHIRDATNHHPGFTPYWLNEFKPQDPATQQAASCNAVRINMFPEDYFIKCELEQFYPQEVMPRAELVDLTLIHLRNELRSGIRIAEIDQQMMRALFYSHAGNYRLVDEMLAGIDESAVRALPVRRQAHFHLARAAVMHERSRYIQVAIQSRKALRVALPVFESGYMIHALTTWSESWRMRIPADTYFLNDDWRASALTLVTLAHFTMTTLLSVFIMLLTLKSVDRLKPHARHSLLEHGIRLGAIMQRITWPLSRRSSLFSNALCAGWMAWFSICHRYGYAAGMANSYKFVFRLNPDYGQYWSNTIYSLFSHRTGIELITRNEADLAASKGETKRAFFLYRHLYTLAEKSGNTLNAIKGLLGIFALRKQLNEVPLATGDEIIAYDKLTAEVEGNLWRRHFSTVRSEILNPGEIRRHYAD